VHSVSSSFRFFTHLLLHYTTIPTNVFDATQASAISFFHNLPRFGNSDDLSKVFSGNPEDVQEYAVGLIFLGALIMVLFSLWGLVVLVFKCLGSKRVGFLSGHGFSLKSKSSATVRGVFLFSNLMVLLFSILLVTRGVTELQSTVTTFDESNQEIVRIQQGLSTISRNLQTTANDAIAIRDDLVAFLSQDICPNQELGASAIKDEIQNFADATLTNLQQIEDFVASDLQDMDNALADANEATDAIDDLLQAAQPTDFQTRAILIPYLIIPSFFIVALILGWRDKYPRGFYFILHTMILPLFIMLVVLAVIVCTAITLGAITNADWCTGGEEESPDANIRAIFTELQVSPDSTTYRLAMFYLSQCEAENPLDFLEFYYDDLVRKKVGRRGKHSY
jgi:hypothetical protein